MKKPLAYQQNHGVHQPVEASFVMKDHGQVRLALGNYDRSRELVIDPAVTLNYATYLGGSLADEALGIAIDGSGDSYITGDTDSTNFPGTPKTLRTPGGVEAFVTKLKSDGTAILYSTLFGGSGDDFGLGITVDSAGDAFVSGNTASTDFPVTLATAAQSTSAAGPRTHSWRNLTPPAARCSMQPISEGAATKMDSLWLSIAPAMHISAETPFRQISPLSALPTAA